MGFNTMIYNYYKLLLGGLVISQKNTKNARAANTGTKMKIKKKRDCGDI